MLKPIKRISAQSLIANTLKTSYFIGYDVFFINTDAPANSGRCYVYSKVGEGLLISIKKTLTTLKIQHQ